MYPGQKQTQPSRTSRSNAETTFTAVITAGPATAAAATAPIPPGAPPGDGPRANRARRRRGRTAPEPKAYRIRADAGGEAPASPPRAGPNRDRTGTEGDAQHGPADAETGAAGVPYASPAAGALDVSRVFRRGAGTDPTPAAFSR
jgi:hypothetical protein